MSRSLRRFGFIALLGAFLLPVVAFAHEHREVGPYEFVVGFMNEPAFEGEQNGVSLRITDKATGEPIAGLADTIDAQVIFGDQQRDLELRPAWGEDGLYVSNFYPTAAGDYTFRFVGEINGTPIDERFTSSPEGFDSVKPTAALQFPAAVPSTAELDQQLAAAESTARIALIVGAIGVGVGLLGLIVALMALRARRGDAAAHRPSPART